MPEKIVLSPIDVLTQIKNRTYQPRPYEEVALSGRSKDLMDFVVKSTLDGKMPKLKEVKSSLKFSQGYLEQLTYELQDMSLIIKPTIFDLLAVWGKYVHGMSTYVFENERLTKLLYNDLRAIRGGEGRGAKKSIHERIEDAKSGKMHERIWKYFIAIVSVNSEPAYSNLLYGNQT